MRHCGIINHPYGYLAHRYGCPVPSHQQTAWCDHECSPSGSCMIDINTELGVLMRRLTIDQASPLYQALYCQSTSAECINSQATEACIERPYVRNQRSV